jgi:hypothetical protein
VIVGQPIEAAPDAVAPPARVFGGFGLWRRR